MAVLGSVAASVREAPRSWAEVDLGAFARNVGQARRLAPSGRLLAVLKADAYGHGAARLAPVALGAGASGIGVGDSTEALLLRTLGLEAPIMVLGALVESEIPAVVRERIIPVVNSEGRCAAIEAEAARQRIQVSVHLKVDTGMGRLGVLPSRAMGLARRILASPWLRLDGLMSHLAGDTGSESNGAQATLFADVAGTLESEGIRFPEIHLRNTAGLLDPSLRAGRETMARCGACLFGFAPEDGAVGFPFEPVLSLRTQVVFLKDLPAGFPVGYGSDRVTERPTRIAILPLGYADGWRRSLAPGGRVLVRGKPAPIFGRVSMDYTTIDVTEIQGVAVGDHVTLIGRDGEESISVSEVARTAGTIPYEVLCGLGPRVVRRSLQT